MDVVKYNAFANKGTRRSGATSEGPGQCKNKENVGAAQMLKRFNFQGAEHNTTDISM